MIYCLNFTTEHFNDDIFECPELFSTDSLNLKNEVSLDHDDWHSPFIGQSQKFGPFWLDHSREYFFGINIYSEDRDKLTALISCLELIGNEGDMLEVVKAAVSLLALGDEHI